MLLKCSNLDKRVIPSKGKGKIQRTASGLKMTVSSTTALNTKTHRKVLRIPAKRHPGKSLPGKLSSITKHSPGKFTSGKRILNRPNLPPCDNSNDSGLGFDQHLENNNHTCVDNRTTSTTIRSNPLIFNTQRTLNADSDNKARNVSWPGDGNGVPKHQKMNNNNNNNIDIDSDDACSNDTFMLAQRNKEEGSMNVREADTDANPAKHLNTNVTRSVYRVQQRRVTAPCQAQGNQNISKDGKSQLHILVQPEQQHRARYQTEGSRGAVKDRSGNGFPVVKLIGYSKPAVLQVFIGTDIGRVTPHMFYQACKVSGKNSTPCIEKKVEGTMYIEIELKPENDMMVTCDCVGILKERNVDVELRFPNQAEPRNKKKSTRCRMVFRVQIENDDGVTELLQSCSQQIICTQPPGVPEICKKSLTSCPANGGLELFIIGKNFLKDSRVIFKGKKLYDNDAGLSTLQPVWEESVVPDKEYLQPNHLVCTVPSYFNQDITEAVTVQIYVVSSGKKSESQNFIYLPKDSYGILSVAATTASNNVKLPTHGSLQLTTPQDTQYGNDSNDKNSLSLWNSSALEQKSEIDAGMMPPPAALPIALRRPSQTNVVTIQNEQQISSPMDLKSEMMDECSQNSMDCMRAASSSPPDENSNISMIVNENSMEHVTSMPINMNLTNGHIDMLTNAEEMKVIDLRVKQEQMAQFQAFVNSNSNQMLPSLQEMNTNVTQIVSPSQESSMVFQQQIITNATQAQPTTTFLDSLCNRTTEMLDIQSNSNSPDSLLASANHSPHTQDIILNSQSAVLNPQNMPQMMSANNSQSRHSMSPEIILDPAVSPTMMCQTNADTANLLSGISLPQTTQDVMLNNLIPSSLAQQNDVTLHMSHKPAPVAVKSMLLHAANEILTSQSTNPLNGLISIDQTILQNQDTQVNSMLINQTQTTTNGANQMQNIPMYHSNTNQENRIHHQMINQNGILLNQTDQSMQTRDNNFIHVTNGNIHEIPNLNQESHLQNITLEQNMMNDTQKIITTQTAGGVSTTTTTTIPQELTTMSDHDLISYINTSCFDQI